MYITKETDYAVRIVHCLAKSSGRRRDARSISDDVCVSLRFSLKILGKLSAAGIVNSFKGNRGGYELARPAAQITLKDVLCAVEGPYVMCRCVAQGECDCGPLDDCAFHREFARISEEVNRQLEAVDFQSVMDKAE